jgi:FAD:protein FMN transferase
LPGSVEPAEVVPEPWTREPHSERSLCSPSMGGTLTLRVACPAGAVGQAERDLRRVAARVDAWARRLTRFREDSDLSALNRSGDAPSVRVRPILGEILVRAHGARVRTEGLVDVTLLDARLDAERAAFEVRESGRWWVEGRGRDRTVGREGRVRFDLDGVAKGWFADRALAMLRAYPATLVDADGDVALRVPAGSGWQVSIADPFDETTDLAMLSVPGARRAHPFGVATSGTSVHRWYGADGWRHHLIDPRTGRPSDTDVVQATVVAESAFAAETLAKAAVIAGSNEGIRLLDRSGAWAAVLLRESGEVIASAETMQWLA